MKIYLIRHGQTDWNVQGKIQGSFESELNAAGVKQAEELGRQLLESGCKFARIYSSRQKRAVMTAEILCEAVNASCIQVNGLEEMNLGKWEGHTWAEVKVKYPTEFTEWLAKRRYTKTPEGESYQDVLDRVLPALQKIIGENDEQDNFVVVTHGAVIMSLQCYLTNTPFDEMDKFKAKNTSITVLDSEQLYN